jgi:hypothetical protein
MHDIALNLFLIATTLEHLGEAVHVAHARTQASSDLQRVDVLVKFVRIS